MKECPSCDRVLPLDSFGKNRSKRDKLGVNCKECERNNSKLLKELRKKHPNAQKCQCCGRTDRRMILDHDHKTKKFRGWLCGHCNTAIGFMDDDVSQLKKAILYLEGV